MFFVSNPLAAVIILSVIHLKAGDFTPTLIKIITKEHTDFGNGDSV